MRDTEDTVVNKRQVIPAILAWWGRLILMQTALVDT